MSVKIIAPTITTNFLQKKRLRVAAYARVSTMSDAQEESYENQKKYYEDRIRANPDWEYVDIFADRAISGTTDRRPGFQKMIVAVKNRELDLVLTKSISRFSRKISDLMKYIELFKSYDVNIIFEEDHIDLRDDKSGLILSILGAVAQMEVENISSHVRWTANEKMKHGELVNASVPLGYNIVEENGERKLIVNEEEAKVDL